VNGAARVTPTGGRTAERLSPAGDLRLPADTMTGHDSSVDSAFTDLHTPRGTTVPPRPARPTRVNARRPPSSCVFRQGRPDDLQSVARTHGIPLRDLDDQQVADIVWANQQRRVLPPRHAARVVSRGVRRAPGRHVDPDASRRSVAGRRHVTGFGICEGTTLRAIAAARDGDVSGSTPSMEELVDRTGLTFGSSPLRPTTCRPPRASSIRPAPPVPEGESSAGRVGHVPYGVPE
jgi:hypothetical protein